MCSLPLLERPLVVISALIFGCATGANDPESHGGGTAQEVTPQKLYEQRCGSCHGAAGVGTEVGPQIQNPVVGYATYVTRTGRNEMGYPNGMNPIAEAGLPDEDLSAILDFLGEAKKPADGQGLYVRFCANCHGVDANGGRVDKALLGEAEEDEFVEAIREGEGDQNYGDREEYMPSYSSTDLTEQEGELIRVYVASLGPGEEEEEEDEDDEADEED